MENNSGRWLVMVTVNMLKPYYIKGDTDYVRVVLAHNYFSLLIKEQVYHFIPIEAKEIKINRRTKKIVNVNDRFAFQKGQEIIYIAMGELITLPDFLIQLYFIIESYDARSMLQSEEMGESDVIKTLERANIKRLIDKALDERDEVAFYQLMKTLKQ